MCADAGLSPQDVAKALHVTKRTVQYWISGRVAIPYAAYRLMRILGRYELPHPAWAGWVFHSGKLWSPEGHGFAPADSNWWGRLCSQARLWREMTERSRQFDMLMLRAGRLPTGPSGAAGGTPDRAAGGPTGEAGRAAQPPGLDLSLGHFRTQDTRNAGSTEEKPPPGIRARFGQQPLTRPDRGVGGVAPDGGSGLVRLAALLAGVPSALQEPASRPGKPSSAASK